MASEPLPLESVKVFAEPVDDSSSEFVLVGDAGAVDVNVEVLQVEVAGPGAGGVAEGCARLSRVGRDGEVGANLVLPHLGDMPLKAIHPSDLQRRTSDLTADGKSPATVRKAWQIASGVLKLAVRDRLIASTPAQDVELPVDHREEPTFVEAHQVLELAEAMDDRWSVMVLLAGFGGLRFGEVAGLQVDDVDFLNRRVTVRRSVSDVKGETHVGPPKTAKSRRTVALPAAVVEAIAEHVSSQDRAGTDCLFTDPEGGPIRATYWQRRVWPPAVAAGDLEELRFHDLRHSHVTLLIAQGEHPGRSPIAWATRR